MKNTKKETEIIYYTDEVNDDFSNVKPKVKPLPDSYKYIHRNIFYRIGARLFTNLVAVPILWCITKIKNASKVENKKVLKSVKDKGYFLYSNHTGVHDIFNHGALVNASRRSLFAASHETFSIPFLKHLIAFMGGFPIPKSDIQYKNYVDFMKYSIDHKAKIIIYPEAHIWRYYTGIRHFKTGSFRYPCLFDSPVIVSTTIFKKRKHHNRPKCICVLDGPFYPNKNLPYEERVNDLHNRVYNAMVKRASDPNNYAYVKYIKKD